MQLSDIALHARALPDLPGRLQQVADVAVSDAWTRVEKGEYKFKAHSRLLVRTERGAELVRDAVDYVDLYFILTGHHSIDRVSAKADELFGGDFSGKLFREQLCYFDDVDYTESVDYLGPPTPDARIREGLIELSTRIV